MTGRKSEYCTMPLAVGSRTCTRIIVNCLVSRFEGVGVSGAVGSRKWMRLGH